MKKFNFRLQRVIEVREVKKKECQRDLARSLEDLKLKEKVLQDAADESKNSHEGLRQALCKKANAGLLASLDRWRARQEDEVKVQTVRTEEQRREVDHRRAALILAAKDKKVLERLKEQRMEEHQTHMRREEQAFLDELGCRIGRTWARSEKLEKGE
jgi:flagellar protein FliJ